MMSQPLEDKVSVSAVAEPLKNMDDQGSQISTKCFGISLIVKAIMKHTSNVDLLNLSMVNRLCNYEARSMMRDRGCFTARLKSRNPCQDLLALASLLENMNVVPYGGISMDLNSSHFDACAKLSSTPQLRSSHHKILEQLPWKNLSVTYSGYWPLDVNCSASHLLIKVLQEFCGNLEELSLRVEPFAVLWLSKVIQDSKFSRLRTLRYEADAGHPYCYAAHVSFIQSVVSRAGQSRPVRLHLNEYIPHMEPALEGGSVELVADYDFNPVLHTFSHSVIPYIRLTKLTLAFHRFGMALSFERFSRIVPVLLRSSCTLLTSLHVDLMYAVPLMCYGVCLKNLTYLKIDMGFLSADFPQLINLSKGLDFTQLFPQLKEVHVVLYSYSRPRVDIRQFACALNEPMPHRAANIKCLTISSTTKPQGAPIPLLAQMFPHIEKLTFDTYEKRKTVFGQIWKHWLELEELEVGASFGKFIWSKRESPVTKWNENLDSEFCGIFPQEVAELRDKDVDFLKAVNIVPVMPAITCMRALRTLRMLCSENVRHSGENDPNFIFSKVTCLIAFARCSNLSVVLETTSHEFENALSHIKPYASVIFDDAVAKYELD